MKYFLITAMIMLFAVPSLASSVSVSVGQPGFYGSIDVGRERPELYNNSPVIIEHERVVQAPLYVRVPEEHRRDWKRHCREYNGCNRPVYFVNDNWYNKHYSDHRNRDNDRNRRHEQKRNKHNERKNNTHKY